MGLWGTSRIMRRGLVLMAYGAEMHQALLRDNKCDQTGKASQVGGQNGRAPIKQCLSPTRLFYLANHCHSACFMTVILQAEVLRNCSVITVHVRCNAAPAPHRHRLCNDVLNTAKCMQAMCGRALQLNWCYALSKLVFPIENGDSILELLQGVFHPEVKFGVLRNHHFSCELTLRGKSWLGIF